LLDAIHLACVTDQKQVRCAGRAVCALLLEWQVLNQAAPDGAQSFMEQYLELALLGIRPFKINRIVAIQIEGFVEPAVVAMVFGVEILFCF